MTFFTLGARPFRRITNVPISGDCELTTGPVVQHGDVPPVLARLQPQLALVAVGNPIGTAHGLEFGGADRAFAVGRAGSLHAGGAVLALMVAARTFLAAYPRVGNFDCRAGQASCSLQFTLRRECSAVFRANRPHDGLAVRRTLAMSYSEFIYGAFFPQSASDAGAWIYT